MSFLTGNTPDFAFSIPGNFNWTFVFVWGFIALITFIDPGFYQRVFSGSSLKTVQKGIMISVLFWVIFDFMTVFTGLYALAVLPVIESSPYLDLAQRVLPPMAKGLFMVSLFAIVMSTVDSFSFISAFTIGKDLTALLNLKQDDANILQYTRWGLVITALLSLLLAMYFEYALDIWYLAGSFVVPTLLFPLIAGLYRIKLKYVSFLMTAPLIVSICWYLYGISHPIANGYPGYILGLDPMYSGVVLSWILYYFLRE